MKRPQFITRRARASRSARRAAEMALSTLSGDEQGIILGQLCSTLEPRLAMYFSGACTELRALLPPAVRQQLRADYEAAAALCLKMGMLKRSPVSSPRSCVQHGALRRAA